MLIFLLACGDVDKHDHDHHNHDHEVMTTVIATFSSDAEDMVYTWSDVEQDGEPEIDDVTLANGSSYTLTLQFLNELEEPAEDVTPEIVDEADEHLVFFTGNAFDTLLQYSYLDADENGLPLGVEGTIETLEAGSGELTISLRHMPPESGNAVKIDGLVEQVDSDGFGDVGGANDIMVTFPVLVE